MATNILAVIIYSSLGVDMGKEEQPSSAKTWRIINADAIEVAWRVRSLQFFSDLSCTVPLNASPNFTGDAFATAASDMTGAEHVFALRSPRGWESLDACETGSCHIGFSWTEDSVDVQCILLLQGEAGLHAGAVTLQWQSLDASGLWHDATTWRPVEAGKQKLSRSCPSKPTVFRGSVGECKSDGPRAEECAVTCDAGFGTLAPKLQCLHGSWYVPECLELGSLVRIVARTPDLIKPYWVILDAAFYTNEDCTGVLRMDGAAISSGEYVIKYANYHAKNAWDGDSTTSWASSEPCTPGSCYVGFRFRKAPEEPIRCVRVEHPRGTQYQASSISVEKLGTAGWEELGQVAVQLLPEAHQEL